MSDCNELVSRLREGTFGTDITKTDTFLNAITAKAAAQIERDGREIKRLRNALEAAADALDDYNPLTGNKIETFSSRAARAALRSTETSHD